MCRPWQLVPIESSTGHSWKLNRSYSFRILGNCTVLRCSFYQLSKSSPMRLKFQFFRHQNSEKLNPENYWENLLISAHFWAVNKSNKRVVSHNWVVSQLSILLHKASILLFTAGEFRSPVEKPLKPVIVPPDCALWDFLTQNSDTDTILTFVSVTV